MVKSPAEYQWSGYRVNAPGQRQALITCHDIYRRPGSSDRERQGNYRLLLNAAIDPADEKLISQAAICSMQQVIAVSRHKLKR
jgi:hypothetical protein